MLGQPISLSRSMQRRVSISDPLFDGGHADAEQHLQACFGGIAVHHRGCTSFETPRGVGGAVGSDIHGGDVFLREPPTVGGEQGVHERIAYIQKTDAGGAEQILEHSTDREIDVQLLHVDIDAADGLIAVEQHFRAAARARYAR